MQATKLKVLSNVQVSSRYWHMVVDMSKLQQRVEPGQFFHILCSDEYVPFLRRPFSVYRVNGSEGTLEFLYLVKGLGTKRLTQIAEGGTVDVFGPLGRGFTLQEDWDCILLLARGVGIATLAALAQHAAEKGVRTVAILSARTRNDLLAAETLQQLGTDVYNVTEEEGTSDVGNVRELIYEILEKHSIKAAYTCGSKRLARLLQDIAVTRNIPSEIALEEHMGCAMGVCFACVCDVKEDGLVRPVRVCREGPVFPLEKVVIG